MPSHNPIPVKMTAIDCLLSQEQATQAQGFAEALSDLRADAAQQLHKAGVTLDGWVVGHPLESRIRAVLLEPLHADALTLLGLFDRLDTRLRIFLPAPSLAQFLTGLELQNADIQAQHSAAPRNTATPIPGASLLSSIHMALSRSHMALSLSASALHERLRSNGRLLPTEQESIDAIHMAEATVREAMKKLDAFRHDSATQNDATYTQHAGGERP